LLSCSSGSGAEKVSENVLSFSLFETASFTDPSSCLPRFSIGTLVCCHWLGLMMHTSVQSIQSCHQLTAGNPPNVISLLFQSLTHMYSSQFCMLCGLACLGCLSLHMSFFLVCILLFVSAIVLLTTISIW